DVTQSDGGASGTDVDGDDQPAAGANAEHRGASAARRGRGSLLEDDSTLHELAHERRERASADAHPACELRARDRLILPNEIEHDPAIHIARCRTSGQSKVSGVDLPHVVSPGREVWGPLFPLPSVLLIPCRVQPFLPPKKSGPSFGEGPRRVSSRCPLQLCR